MTMKTIYARSLMISFLFFAGQVTAQKYYPGGLGNSNLFLWLNANKSSSITMNGSNQVSQWNDLSGNGNNFSQGAAGTRPVYGATANPGGRPGLTFSAASSQYMSLASLPATLSFASGVSAFAQVSYGPTLAGWGWQRVFDFGNGTSNNNFMMGRDGNTANNYYEGWKGGAGDQTYTSTNPIVNNTENLYEAVQAGGTAGTLTNVSQYLAGVSQTVTGAAGSSQTWLPAAIARTANYIGRSNWAADEYFNGTMSEVLLYNTAVNSTQRVILENYLGAEWNQAVNKKIYTPPTTTTYGTSLVGIGYTSAADNFLSDIAGSTDGLGFTSGTTASDFLNVAGYISAAHNGQSNTALSNVTISNIWSLTPLSRWNRSWYFQQTGGNTTGSATVTFNFSDYNGSAPSSLLNYALLYNAADGTFTTGTNKLVTTTATTISTVSNTVAFKAAASNLSAGYYTIVYSNSPITLPVTLNTFTVVPQDGVAKLDWSTAGQTGFSRFDIQRAGDDQSFARIAAVDAVANSTTPGDYTFTDDNPLAGKNYYRLAMVDQDGSITYSAIHIVNFASGSGAITLSVYPNPVMDNLHLIFTHATGAITVRLINSQGQVMRNNTASSPTNVEIPVSTLARGIYFVEVQGADGSRIVREVFKQ